MTHQAFDTFVRRTAITRDRRSALGLLTGAALAALAPRGVSATFGGGKPKNECDDKKDKQKAKKKTKACEAQADVFCLSNTDFFNALSCSLDFEACCEFRAACQKKEALRCVRQVAAKYGIVL